MNSILLLIIFIPIIEIYLFIKIGAQIGAIYTILLIFITAVVGVYYAKYEGLNTLKSGFIQISKNEPPTYEMISGVAIAIAAPDIISYVGVSFFLNWVNPALRVFKPSYLA